MRNSAMKIRVGFIVACLSLIFAHAAEAQRVFLDTDGDGVSTPSDRLNPSGQTVVSVYLDTCHDRDGVLQACNGHTGASRSQASLDFFCYDLILQVRPKSGSVRWG